VLKRSSIVVISLAALTLFSLSACSEGTENPFGTTTPVTEGEALAPANNESVSPGPDIANGQDKFKGLGCSGCHTTGSDKLVGSGLRGVGSKGDDYVRQSIVDPAAVVVDGYSDLMPKSFASLKESDIEDLIGYLKTLN
jgi:cytochrome c2